MRREIDWCWRAAMVAAAGLTLAGCSLTTASAESCTDNAACREAFGLGYFCGSKGYCREAPIPARCTETYPDDLLTNPSENADLIVIGSIQDRSVDSKLGRERALRLALMQANSAGGLDGTEFGVVFCTSAVDDAYDELGRAEAAVENATYLAETIGVPAIVGPSASADTQAVFLALQDLGTETLVMSPAASGPGLTDLETETPGLLWRTAPPDTAQGRAIAADMTTLSTDSARAAVVDDVVVVYEAGAYGEGLFNAFASNFEAAGRTVESVMFSNEAQRGGAVVDVTFASPDASEALFIAQTVDVLEIMEATALLPWYDTRTFFVTDTVANQDFITGMKSRLGDGAAQALFARIRGTEPAQPENAIYSSFLIQYNSEYDESPEGLSFTAHAYDAAWLVMYGIAWAELNAGEITGPTIASGLTQISDASATTFEIKATNWQLVVEEFRTGNAIDVTGASGELDYDPVTEETTGNVAVWTIGSDAIVEDYVWVP